jgi:polyribonucleotide nucleotidyltransferase
VINVGDEITVMVTEVAPNGKVSLSRRAALTGELPEPKPERPPRREGDRGPRREGDRGPRRDDRGFAPRGDREPRPGPERDRPELPSRPGDSRRRPVGQSGDAW